MSDAKMQASGFLKSFGEFSKGKIQNEEDLARVVELAFEYGNKELLGELAFEAKYLSGLFRIIKSPENKLEEEYFGRVKGEYTAHIVKIKELFTKIIEPGSGFIKEIFEKKYFGLTQENLENLIKLCEDLARLKSYLNELKEKGEGF